MILSKKAFRKKARKRRHERFDENLNEKIVARFLNSPWYKNANKIMITSAIDDEIDLGEVLSRAKADGKDVYFPVVDGKNIYPVSADFPLVRSAYGILEPDGPAYTGKVDLIVVPGLAFSEDGYRVGYGGGYYDRFLKDTDALTLSLSPEALIYAELPVEAQDVPVDVVISEDRILRND